MTNTNQPGFFAYPSADIATVTGDGTDYTIAFNSTLFNNGTNYSTSTYAFTAPVTGNYQFNLSVSCSALNTTNSSVNINLNHSNGNFYRIASDNFTSTTYGAGAAAQWCGSMIIPMTAADTINAHVIIGGSATKNVKLGGLEAGTFYTSHWSGFLVC